MADLEKDYDAWHSAMAISSTPLDFPWYETAFRHMEKEARGAILEVGCGRGEFSCLMAETLPGSRIFAIDFSARAVEIAKQVAVHKGRDVQFFQDDAQSLHFPDGMFDYVVSCECMEHVPDPAKMAQEIFRVLKPGGRFLLTTENYFNGMLIGWLWAWLWREKFNSGSGVQPHENFFFFWIVRRYLRKAGLIVEKTESSHYQWLLLPGFDPASLCTFQFSQGWARALAKPFGRHFSFIGRKPGA